MANDYKSKEPTKNEKMIYELYMQMQNMDRSLYTNSTLIISLGILLDIKPEKLAEMLVNGNEKVKEYSKKVNEEINKLEKEKQKEQGHEHGHDHGHKHEDSGEKSQEQNTAN